MNCLLSILLTAILCASASAQTIKTLGFNTNGQVVANTGTNVSLTFTNEAVKFAKGDLSISNQTISGSGVAFSFEDGSFDAGASVVREQLGFSTNLNTLWTATNASNARSAVGLGSTNNVEFNSASINELRWEGGLIFEPETGTFQFPINFSTNNNGAAITRTNLGLALAALTNTSNVTTMRALAGSTNTNQPFSGTFVFVDDAANTWSATVSNGIILSVIEQ